jgi:hypothetical protein
MAAIAHNILLLPFSAKALTKTERFVIKDGRPLCGLACLRFSQRRSTKPTCCWKSALGIKMAGGSRGTTQKSLSSENDDEESESESDSEGDSHKHGLQQVPASTVHVDDCSDVQVGPRLTYNGPVTVNQIVQVTGGDGGYNDVISQQRLLRQTITAPANSADPLSSNANGRQHIGYQN